MAEEKTKPVGKSGRARGRPRLPLTEEERKERVRRRCRDYYRRNKGRMTAAVKKCRRGKKAANGSLPTVADREEGKRRQEEIEQRRLLRKVDGQLLHCPPLPRRALNTLQGLWPSITAGYKEAALEYRRVLEGILARKQVEEADAEAAGVFRNQYQGPEDEEDEEVEEVLADGGSEIPPGTCPPREGADGSSGAGEDQKPGANSLPPVGGYISRHFLPIRYNR